MVAGRKVSADEEVEDRDSVQISARDGELSTKRRGGLRVLLAGGPAQPNLDGSP